MTDNTEALAYARTIVAECSAGRTMPLQLVQLAELAIEQHQDASRYRAHREWMAREGGITVEQVDARNDEEIARAVAASKETTHD